MVKVLREHGVEWVALAGYMRILTPEFLQAFSGQVLNVHPSLLPAFSGTQGCVDTLAYGVKIAGATIHFVEKDLDSGPVIIQAAIPVGVGDTLKSVTTRVHALEHRIYPQALQWIAAGRLTRAGENNRIIAIRPDARLRGREEPGCIFSPPLDLGF
jgi:phosphoribosylglycinamide formyltransferase-1